MVRLDKAANKIIFIVLLFLSIMGCRQSRYPDLLLINGNIYTMDDINPYVQAVGVTDGRISFIGGNDPALELKGPATFVIDLKGKGMTPGLIEGHGHFMGMGYNLLNLDLSETKSYEEVVEMVKAKIAVSAPGEWIIGRGWHQSKWDPLPGKMHNGFPSHHLLSNISPDNPVVLRHASGHALLVNQKTMDLAGISRDTYLVEGGEILKDEAGNPTGIFIETAMNLISPYIPDNDSISDSRAYKLAVENCLKEGITSFHDAGADGTTIALYKRMVEMGETTIRLYVMLDGSDSLLMEKYFSKGPEIDSLRHMLTVRSIKLYMDGALGSRGAWLLEPYLDRPDHTGHAVSSADYITMIAERAIRHRFQVCIHAIGDRANRETLNIYESVFRKFPEYHDTRFRIEHAQHLSGEDIPRFARLGVLPAMQAIHMSSDRPWAIDRLGSKRIEEGAYVWQKLLQSGARIINGTDVPVEPLSPIQCFYASVTRKTLQGFPPEGFEPAQKMSREQALRSYTLDAAYGAFEETVKGSIELGKLADFTVFSDDIMTIPEDEILKSKVVMTIIQGEIVYQSD